ncbi:Phosphofurin acidic cluster sorting protein 1 [Taenia solium]|eukprot:TsM_000469900 transcript=TsM_000469900 gene=TsM_000469900
MWDKRPPRCLVKVQKQEIRFVEINTVTLTMISMKMSAIWEVEKSSSCSVRRLCHIQIGQIILDRPIDLGENASSGFYVALRMRGNTRRILRSPEVSLIVPKHPSSSTVSATASNSATRGVGVYIPIDLNCTIRYSHVLKMDSNILQILLQKRKKYKNTTMNLGYKTLAYCNISLSQVLQRRIEHRFLSMYPNPKCIGPAIARIEVHCLSTLPWERDPINPGNKGWPTPLHPPMTAILFPLVSGVVQPKHLGEEEEEVKYVAAERTAHRW